MSESKTAHTGREHRGPHAFGKMKPIDRDDPLKPTLDEIAAQLEAEGEPLSLAEEIAEEVDNADGDIVHEHYESVKQGDIHIAELQRMTMPQLIEEARKEKLADITGIKRQDLIFKILKERVKLNGLMFGEGTLEILPDGFGFLRSPDYHYLSCPDDIYVSPSQIRRFGLRTGTTVAGQIRPPKENERYFALAARRGDQLRRSEQAVRQGLLRRPDAAASRQADRAGDRLPTKLNMRVVDLIVPIGFGQRGLIVSPPRAGKTILLQKMAKSRARATIPDAYVIMLLIDERPEEVTDMERQVKGPQLRGHQLARSTSPPPATSRSPKWSSKKPSGWSNTATT